MNKTIKRFLLICLLLVTVTVISGCSGKTVYETFDEDGYNVSIRFDAGNGTLLPQISAIVDSYNISSLKPNSKGEVEIALMDPTDERRGSVDVCQPQYPESGYYLAGWYAERTPNPDGDGYTYSKPWDFQKDRVRISADGTYSASEPVLTLYAKWMPLLMVQVYDRETNELLQEIPFDPNVDEVQMPEWKKDSRKGAIDMNDLDIPKKEGYTFAGAYYDPEGTQSVPYGQLLSYEDAPNAADNVIKVYTDWMEGEWFYIYTAKQLINSASASGNYVLFDDLDFEGQEWPRTFLSKEFTGSIRSAEGSQYTIRNITFSEKDADRAGLFRSIGADAVITGVTFENVTFNLNKGNSRAPLCQYGLFASSISDEAEISQVNIINSRILISDHIYQNTYIVGLIAGGGNTGAIDWSGISCTIVECTDSNCEADWKFTVEVIGNTVYIESK